MLTLTRRKLIVSASALIVAPAIVRIENIMPVKLVDLEFDGPMLVSIAHPEPHRLGWSIVRGVTVSTIDLAQFGPHAVMFGNRYETMVFGGELDGFQARYPTAQEAINCHNAIVKDLSHPHARDL